MSRFVLAVLLVLAPGAASAAPTCATMIADLRGWLDAHPHVSGTRRQTVDAQLQHQPNAASVAKAKMDSRDHLVELLGEAQMRQRMGDKAGCETTLADVERMIKP